MEVERNFRSQLRAAELIHREHPETRFLAACFKESHQKMAEEMRRPFPSLPLQICVKKTPEIMEVSKTCIAVSGSVSLELLYRARPTVIVYRVSKVMAVVFRRLLKARYITLVNLLADKMLFPEFPSEFCQADNAAREVLHWLNDERAYVGVYRELLALREKVTKPGACSRAAQRIIETLETKKTRAA